MTTCSAAMTSYIKAMSPHIAAMATYIKAKTTCSVTMATYIKAKTANNTATLIIPTVSVCILTERSMCFWFVETQTMAWRILKIPAQACLR
ncbi:hypothetical protein [Ekhidna sp.]|uniref:hypothetical protein n=1 Tax=Ekhidna sp. TaxID=2608089 RepID=UPI003B5AEC21